MSDVDSAGPHDKSDIKRRAQSVHAAVRARLHRLGLWPKRVALPEAMDTPFAKDRLDAVADEVLARLQDIPEELVVDHPHQALMDLAAPIAAREKLHDVPPSDACLQSLIDELPAMTRRVFVMHRADPRLGQLAQELGMPEKVVLRHVGQAYCHLRKRLGR